MADSAGSLMRRAAVAACLMLFSVVHARAQRPLPSPTSGTSSPEFLPRAQFHLSAGALHVDDPRFTWDTHFGGEVDLVDYVFGRVNGVADYEAILGNEFRLFDPNQGNYTLEFSASGRVKKTEIAGVFHHESRHLSDRFKRFPIAWNVLGARVLRRFDFSQATVDVQGGAGTVTEHAYVDYRWTADLDIVLRHPVSSRAGVFAHGSGAMYGIDPSLSSRGTQKEGRIEAGVRVHGGDAAVELFGGFERRADADPINFQAERWVFAGFRILSR
jgi:hypothetical protein